MTARSWVRGAALRSSNFPAGTPLNHFFAWNERAWRPDRRYIIACDLYRLLTALGNGADAQRMTVAHLALRPLIIARRGQRVLISDEAPPIDSLGGSDICGATIGTARQTIERLVAAVGSSDIDAHAALFAAFEQLSREIDLDALARAQPSLLKPALRRSRLLRILIIRLSALGDFVQCLGPAAAIRRHHSRDHITLLTTSSLGEFAKRLGCFDEVMFDRRPGPFDVTGWLKLRRSLRQHRFDRVYDLQTSERTAVYSQLFRPGPIPEWSGIAWRCSHPHANLGRDCQHTIDKQAEQLLMAGIHPTRLPTLPSLDCELPGSLAGRRFALMVPGSSARHLAKRWPAQRYGMLAEALRRAGCASVVIGSGSERALGTEIREICPDAIDLVGRTDIETVAALAQRAILTVGNDTGVTHLAAATGCPIVVLFSQASDPARCAPRGRMVRVLAAANLDQVQVDQVLAEAIGIMDQSPPPGGDAGPRKIAREASASGVLS
jgi:ADP-heptose:LPS heptosyltransferase